jgi:hypothetical protein
VYLALGGLLLVVLGGLSFAAASVLEEHDTFCIACHTAPEVTYYNRAYLALDMALAGLPEAPDLATQHYLAAQAEGGAFQCIQCHQGDRGLGHRVSTFALGARDTLVFLAGRDDPAIEKQRTETGWLADAACASCHAPTLLHLDGINNHFHTFLLQSRVMLTRGGVITYGDTFTRALENARRQGLTLRFELETVQADVRCADCHPPHKALPVGMLAEADLRESACVACHVAAGRGPQDRAGLRGGP